MRYFQGDRKPRGLCRGLGRAGCYKYLNNSKTSEKIESDKLNKSGNNHQIAEMKQNAFYSLNMSKKELAIRLACLENVVNHVNMANLVWERWYDNIGYWEAKNGFIFEGMNEEENEERVLTRKQEDLDAKRVAS